MGLAHSYYRSESQIQQLNNRCGGVRKRGSEAAGQNGLGLKLLLPKLFNVINIILLFFIVVLDINASGIEDT